MPITQTERHYPQLPEKFSELQDHFNQLHSNLYDLRDAHQKLQKDHSALAAKKSESVFNDNIQGVKIVGTTDPQTGTAFGGHPATIGSLANGMTIRYNSSTGQFEFGM